MKNKMYRIILPQVNYIKTIYIIFYITVKYVAK